MEYQQEAKQQNNHNNITPIAQEFSESSPLLHAISSQITDHSPNWDHSSQTGIKSTSTDIIFTLWEIIKAGAAIYATMENFVGVSEIHKPHSPTQALFIATVATVGVASLLKALQLAALRKKNLTEAQRQKIKDFYYEVNELHESLATFLITYLFGMRFLSFFFPNDQPLKPPFLFAYITVVGYAVFNAIINITTISLWLFNYFKNTTARFLGKAHNGFINSYAAIGLILAVIYFFDEKTVTDPSHNNYLAMARMMIAGILALGTSVLACKSFKERTDRLEETPLDGIILGSIILGFLWSMITNFITGIKNNDLEIIITHTIILALKPILTGLTYVPFLIEPSANLLMVTEVKKQKLFKYAAESIHCVNFWRETVNPGSPSPQQRDPVALANTVEDGTISNPSPDSRDTPSTIPQAI